jgi:rubrerythrin
MEEFNLCLPYPEVSGEITQRELGDLYDLYAGRFSELTAITSYVYQSIISSDKELSEVLLKISVTEMEHCEMLGKCILAFGADPVFAGRYNYFTCEYTNYSKDVREFLCENIRAEMTARKAYLELAYKTQNQSLRELLTRIAMDEEAHVKTLTEQYYRLFGELPII